MRVRAGVATIFSVAIVLGGASISRALDPATVPATERVSVGAGGTEGDGSSYSAPAVSGDGRWVVFSSVASNLIDNDLGSHRDVFVRDRETGTTERVSVSSAGAGGNDDSGTGFDGGDISADGRFVAFASSASNLVPGDTNGTSDVFVHDRQTNTTERVSIAGDGTEGDGPSLSPAISANGRWIAFESAASSLVPGDGPASDIFLHDRTTATTTRVSRTPLGDQPNGGSHAPEISADGAVVAFWSFATDLTPGPESGAGDVYAFDVATMTSELISADTAGGGADAGSRGGIAVSGDGSRIAFGSEAGDLVAGDENGEDDVFVRDRTTATTALVSAKPGGGTPLQPSYGGAISDDGRWVAFTSAAGSLAPGRPASKGAGDGGGGGGTTRRRLAAGDPATDVYVRDTQNASTRRASLTSAGAAANGDSEQPALSGDGEWVAFASAASNLVPGDANGESDIFARHRTAPAQPGPAFVLTLRDNPDPVAVGDELTYTATVENVGDTPSDADLVVTLPAGAGFDDLSEDCTRDGRVVSCDLGSIVPDDWVNFSFVVTPSAAGVIELAAEVNAAGPEADLSDNSAREQTRVGGKPLIDAPKKAPGGGLIVLKPPPSAGATQLRWDLNRDGRADLITTPSQPFLGLRLQAPGRHRISVTVIGPKTFTATTSIRVTPPPASVPKRLGDLAFSSASKAALIAQVGPVLSCHANTTVVFGIAEAQGCFAHVLNGNDIPASERAVAGEYTALNEFIRARGECKRLFNRQCIEYASREGLEVVYSHSPVKLNGMTVTPQAGAAVVLFPAINRLVSSNARLTFEGAGLPALPFKSGKINLDLRSGLKRFTSGREELAIGTFDARKQLPSIGGFALDGQATVKLEAQNGRRFSSLGINLQLPPVFKAFGGKAPSGGATLEAENSRGGLVLGTIDLRVPEVFLGGIRLANVSFSYKHGGEPGKCGSKWWKATADIFFGTTGVRLSPPPSRNGVAFCAGNFHSGGGEFVFGALAPQIFPGVFLDAINFNMQLSNPTVLSGGARMTAAKIAAVDGGLLTAFATPSSPYVIQAGDGGGTLGGLAGRRVISTTFAVGGAVGLKTPAGILNLGGGYLMYGYPNYVEAAGHVRATLLFFTLNAGGGLQLNAQTGRFSLNAGGEVCLIGGLKIAGLGACAGANAWVTSKGAVACFDLVGWTPGVGFHYGGSPEIFLGVAGDGCKPSRYWETSIVRARTLASAADRTGRRRLAGTGPVAFTLPAGQTHKSIELSGDGGAPDVIVEGPNGETIDADAEEMTREGPLALLEAPAQQKTWVGVIDGDPGTYTVTPKPGSVAITGLRQTRAEPKLEASVGGRGNRRLLRYELGGTPGRRVSFYERGPQTFELLATANKGSGEVPFLPAPGAGGVREIVAQVETGGIPGEPVVLDSFTTSKPAPPGRVGSLRVRRTARGITARWSKSHGAIAYGLQVRGADGVDRGLRVRGRKHSARLRLPRSTRGKLEIRGLGVLGDPGPVRAARFRAAGPAPNRFLPYSRLGKRRR